MQIYSDQHRLENVQRNSINRNSGVNFDLKFSNETLSVEHDSGRMMTFKPFFRTFFTDSVLGRGKTFENDLQIVFEEEIYLMDFVKNSGQLMFACEELDNPMFRVECSEEIYAHDAIVGRTVTVKKTEVTPEELRILLPDINKLNSISESYVTFTN